MMHFLRWLFYAGCVCVVALPVWIAYAYRYQPGLLVDIRNANLCRDAKSADIFVAPPERLVEMGFLTDSKEEIARFRAQYFDKITCLRDLPADFESMDTLERAKTLSCVMSGGGLCEYFGDSTTLFDKLERMRDGAGLCSDHVEGFIALCQLFGIFATEVHGTVHTVAQVWCPETGRWVLIDPEGCILPRDASGRPLNVLETRDAYISGQPVYWDFFGETERHTICTRWDEIGNFDDISDMHELMFTFGSNVFEVDRVRRSMRRVPKVARQLYYQAMGVMPGYLTLSDELTTRGVHFAGIRTRTRVVAGAYVVALGAYPAALLLRRLIGGAGRDDGGGASGQHEDEMPAEPMRVRRSA
jgi:hypothetical protein